MQQDGVIMRLVTFEKQVAWEKWRNRQLTIANEQLMAKVLEQQQLLIDMKKDCDRLIASVHAEAQERILIKEREAEYKVSRAKFSPFEIKKTSF